MGKVVHLHEKQPKEKRKMSIIILGGLGNNEGVGQLDSWILLRREGFLKRIVASPGTTLYCLRFVSCVETLHRSCHCSLTSYCRLGPFWPGLWDGIWGAGAALESSSFLSLLGAQIILCINGNRQGNEQMKLFPSLFWTSNNILRKETKLAFLKSCLWIIFFQLFFFSFSCSSFLILLNSGFSDSSSSLKFI
jgi:hypothetical protein